MNGFRTSLCMAALVAFVAGCSSPVKLDEGAPVADAKPTPVGPGGSTAPGGAAGAGASQSGVTTVDATKTAPAAASGLGAVYFDFDSHARARSSVR
jgi:peptidoglycan-associated lipoprotein